MNNIAEMHPGDALDYANDITAFLEASVCAFVAAGSECFPNKEGWSGLLAVTVVLKELLTRAKEGCWLPADIDKREIHPIDKKEGGAL